MHARLRCDGRSSTWACDCRCSRVMYTVSAMPTNRQGSRLACTASSTPQSNQAGNPPVQAVLFDMDGVLCNSESLSRRAACQVFKELHALSVMENEFIPFGGMGEDRFLGGIATKYNVQGFDPALAKQRFFDIYINTYARPESNIVYPGAIKLVRACKAAGLKTAVASSAERVKVDANLTAAGFAAGDFDAVVSASGFERIKPEPDIFLAAAALVGVEPSSCVVVEDASAGIRAARAAGMRVVGVTTSLSPEEMRNEAPDVVYPNISGISVDAILGVQYATLVRT